MIYNVLYAFLSVLVISLISILAVLAFSFQMTTIKKYLLFAVSFSTGSLLGGAFLHLLPEAIEKYGYFDLKIGLFVLSGFLTMFITEKIIHWRHCHNPQHIDKCVHSFAFMNLIGDAFHNLIDGLVIGASFLVDIKLGFATTLAVILHELPQEIGDFGVLLHGGFSKKKAIFFNFLSALFAFFGVIIAIILGFKSANMLFFLLPFAAGNFIYIAASDLVPELHKETELKNNLKNFLFIILGIAFMYGVLFLPFGEKHVDNENTKIYLDGQNITWEETKNLLTACEVYGVFQNHQKEVEIEIKNGNKLHTISPEIDNIFTVVKENEEKCGKLIYMATE
ncbi:MAG: ZIP family metal transporter [Patescibacteria group bacterium]